MQTACLLSLCVYYHFYGYQMCRLQPYLKILDWGGNVSANVLAYNATKKGLYNLGTRLGHFHDTSFYLKLINGPNKLECSFLASLFSLV
jgi:hypothetical protein